MRDRSAEDAFEEIGNPEVEKLREFIEKLTDRQKYICQAMLMEYEGGGLLISNEELAEKWGVSMKAINKEKERLKERIRKAVRG